MIRAKLHREVRAIDLGFNMNTIIESRLPQVRELCKKYHVSRLELIGSGATQDWNSQSSDLDFLVTFDTPPEGMLGFDQYMDLMLDLQRLYLRRVDLVEEKAVRNPYFLAAVNKQRTLIYERSAQPATPSFGHA